MEIGARVYRPRRAKESPLFRLVEQHLEEFLRTHPERFAARHSPLRPVVERVLRGFLGCGLVYLDGQKAVLYRSKMNPFQDSPPQRHT